MGTGETRQITNNLRKRKQPAVRKKVSIDITGVVSMRGETRKGTDLSEESYEVKEDTKG